MKVIIAGSRNITDKQKVFNLIGSYHGKNKITEVVCGEARGVDLLGREWAEKHNIPIASFPANWTLYGKTAGFKRNVQMALYADRLLAIWDGKSRGTQHMINIMYKQHKPVCIEYITTVVRNHG